MTLALADELFLVTRDLHTGKTKLSEPALGIGVAAALLAELVHAGALVVSDARILDGDRPAPDDLTGRLLDETRMELSSGDVSVEQWLAARQRDVADLVAARMVAAGDLHRQEARRFGRTSVRYWPAASSAAVLRSQRLGASARTRPAISVADTTLAALVRAIAPSGALLALDAVDEVYLRTAVEQLPRPLQEVLAVAAELVRTTRRNPYV